MKSRWYISTLVIILTLLGGVASQQHISVPNQEIVLQFTDNEVTPDEAQNAIAIVKKQLQTIGVDKIRVSEPIKGKLKITYYSDIDVAGIKELLSNEKTFDLTSSKKTQQPIKSSPSDDHSIAYNLDVYEIQDGSNAVSDLGGKLAIEQKPENIRFFNPNFYSPFEDFQVRENNRLVKTAYNFRKSNAIAIDNSSKKIPEVRAGPNS